MKLHGLHTTCEIPFPLFEKTRWLMFLIFSFLKLMQWSALPHTLAFIDKKLAHAGNIIFLNVWW